MKLFKRIFIISSAIIALIIVLDVAMVLGVAHTRPEIPKADSIIVLGAAINTPALRNRTLEGLRVYEQGNVSEMVLSGGKIADADISEAQYMEKVIKKNSKEKVNYILEDQSHNTYENIMNTKFKLDTEGVSTDSVVIVSDAFHLARGVIMAKRAGFNKVYWSAPNSD